MCTETRAFSASLCVWESVFLIISEKQPKSVFTTETKTFMFEDGRSLGNNHQHLLYYSCVITIISPETFFALAHHTAHPFFAVTHWMFSSCLQQKCSSCVSQEVQLGRLATFLINAAFILPRWANMGAVQGDHWYLMVLICLPFLKGKVRIWL